MKTLKMIIGLLVWLGWITFALVFAKSFKEVDLPTTIVFVIMVVLSMLLAVLEGNFNE